MQGPNRCNEVIPSYASAEYLGGKSIARLGLSNGTKWAMRSKPFAGLKPIPNRLTEQQQRENDKIFQKARGFSKPVLPVSLFLPSSLSKVTNSNLILLQFLACKTSFETTRLRHSGKEKSRLAGPCKRSSEHQTQEKTGRSQEKSPTYRNQEAARCGFD